MDPDSGRPAKRFKHQSYQSTLKSVHLPSSTLQSRLDDDIPDSDSHFQHALNHWQQLNLSPAFLHFSAKVQPLSASVPLLLHHSEQIVNLWIETVKDANDDALKALFDLLQKLLHDLRDTLKPFYIRLLSASLGPFTASPSADTLTTLLASLSLLFKNLLGSETGALEESWSMFASTLTQCNSEVQRALAEVWGTLLRRFKAVMRTTAVAVILHDYERISDGAAWIFVSAFKSVTRTLHTCTPSLFETFLNAHLLSSNSARTEVLMRRTITALIHHCDKAEQFSPISDLLISRFLRNVPIERPSLMGLVSTLCSVRKGSRLSQKQISATLSHLAQKSVISCDTRAVVLLSTAALVAAEMPVWMGPGRKLIEASWEDPSLGLTLSGSLSSLDWAGWKLIELPLVLKHSARLLESDSKPTLNLLMSLAQQHRLDDVDEGWIRRISLLLQTRLGNWAISSENVQELVSILSLCPLLYSTGAAVSSIAKQALDFSLSGGLETEDQLAANVFGTSVKALAEIPKSQWYDEVDIPAWLTNALKRWPKHELVLESLVSLSRHHDPGFRIPLEDVYPYLQTSVLSHKRSLRLNALYLMISPTVEQTQSTEVFRQCLHGEEASLDVKGVRERIVKIAGLPQSVNNDDAIGADLCLRWLIAQLQVNLRPLWLPTTKALAVLSQRFAEPMWKLTYEQLELTVNGAPMQSDKSVKVDTSFEVTEDERTWRDPSAAKLRATVEPWLTTGSATDSIFQTREERLDISNYESQLLCVLGEVPTLTHRHNAELIRLFLTFSSPELLTRPPRAKLVNWLTLFSKLDNCKAFHRASTLRDLYSSLLSHPDRDLQTLALTCLLNYKSPHLLPYQKQLRGFLDNTKGSDELISFNMADIEDKARNEVVDVIIRLFFGLMLERHGRAKKIGRRASLLSALNACRQEELKVLIDLMLEPFAMSSTSSEAPENKLTTGKQQVGFLNLLGDVMKRLGSRIVPYWSSLLTLTIKLVAVAQTKLVAKHDGIGHDGIPEAEEEDDGIEADDPTTTVSDRVFRTVRQLGVKRITDFFRCDVPFNFQPYLPSIFASIVSPRLAVLERENTQSPSAIMDLFFVWSLRRDFVQYLVEYDDRVLTKLYACLQAVHVKPAVIALIFDIVEHILALSQDNTDVASTVLKPHISTLLDALAIDLPSHGTRGDLLHRQVGILSQIAQFVSSESQARHVLQHFTPLLKRPSKIIPEKVKVHLLRIIQGIIPMVLELNDSTSPVFVQTYELLSKLFQTLRTKNARVALLDALGQLSSVEPVIKRVHDLLLGLNAFSVKRVDEPDFPVRLQAFTELNETLYTDLTTKEWQPILYNMLQSIQDPEELAIRTNAAYSLKRFIDIVSTQEDLEFQLIFMRLLLPALKNGLLSKVELVRNEVLGVLAHGVSKCNNIAALSELQPLLANGDSEANFFNNIHHIQIHRRTRALRRLADYVATDNVRSTTIAEIFIPIMHHFIVNAPNVDHILVDVAIATTGSLARRLKWGSYNALVRQFMALIKSKTVAERACVRTLVSILENFHFPMEEIVEEESTETNVNQTEDAEPTEDADKSSHPGIATAKEDVPIKKIADAVHTRLLPSLLQHLESRDDNEDSLRIPVSVGIAKVACYLPAASKDSQISRLLTILSQVFRSKSQDTRALARESLCKISVIIGPTYLAQIITELRASLLRGPHLHILATVTHALLLHITSPESVSTFKDLDACAADVAHVSAEVIFGQSGNDVRSEGFTTTILEVRGSSSRGLDSFAIISRHITPARLSALLNPIKGVMHETGASKTLQLVDDVLRRISSGLNANDRLSSLEYFSLCHTLIQQNARFLKDVPRATMGKGKIKKDYVVQTKRKLDKDEDHYSHNSFRFVVMGLDLFNTAFRRNRFDLKDPQIISRLESMIPVIGNTLYSQEAHVVIQGLKATGFVVKCPLKGLDESLPVFVHQIMEIVRQAGSTESEVVQTAFRTLAIIIRECGGSQVKEKDLVHLLEVIGPDLEEPSRQAAVFGLLRAIVSRKFVVAEIYDIMSKVADIMVTNQASQVQEQCRAVLLQFLLDYPQGKGRLQTQMTFFAQNLSYVFESGRRSVMELLSAIFTKFDAALLRGYTDLFFVALVMVMANDDSSKCREMAAELIKVLFTQLDTEHRKAIISHLHTWSAEKARIQLSRVSAQVYGVIVDTLNQDITLYVAGILDDMNAAIRVSASELSRLESGDQSGMDIDVEWQLPYHALNAISKVFRARPEYAKDYNSVDWSAIGQHLLYPHAWVRNASSRLIGTLFSTIAPTSPVASLPDSSLVSLSGLIEVARRSCLQLKSDTLDATLSLQAVKNLFYIGKCFCSMVSTSVPGESDITIEQDPEQNDDSLGHISEPRDKLEAIKANPLPWLFSKLSYQARSAWLARRNRTAEQDNWSEQPLAVFRWFAAMAAYMDLNLLERYLFHILNPVYRILDDDTIHDKHMDDLKALAQELLDLVQTQIGTTKFAGVYNTIRQNITSIRRERKNEKVIQTTVDPQAAARRKILRNQVKKNSRTRTTRVLAEGKVRNNRTKVRRKEVK
ncbi:hypothetical protein BU17DRAFT_83502 [Hysterangium stoloniferum]|nr:hypothetical protein BU17DRAFT_83502 [Hysterangium stoloniferum]